MIEEQGGVYRKVWTEKREEGKWCNYYNLKNEIIKKYQNKSIIEMYWIY